MSQTDAKQGLRGTADYLSNQRPTNFGGRITRVHVNAKLKALKKKKEKSIA
jgi:hypothetical protein